MVEFGFAVAVRIENPVINHPKAINRRVVINAGDNADALDNPADIARILATHTFNVVRVRFVGDRIIKDDVAVFGLHQSCAGFFPHQTRCQFLVFQIPIDAVMVKIINVVSQIRASVIDLARQQILAVNLACCFQAQILIRFSFLRKS